MSIIKRDKGVILREVKQNEHLQKNSFHLYVLLERQVHTEV